MHFTSNTCLRGLVDKRAYFETFGPLPLLVHCMLSKIAGNL